MTTAHRPTWNSAREHGNEHGVWGSGGVRSMQMPSRDMPGHLTMKYRAGHQLEGIHDDRATKIERADAREAGAVARPLLSAEPVAPAPRLLLRSEVFEPGELDKYDDRDDESDGSDDDADSSDDDSDDEAAALALELEKIKKEREAERQRKAAAAEADARASRDAAALDRNPLLNQPTTGAVKRKWNDDVVFRNQARGAPEKKGKTFVNDTIRNDFHKRFLAKYIQ